MTESNLAKFEPRQLATTATDPYTPTTTEQAMQIALAFAKSGLLAGFKSQEQVFLAMAVGAELGIPPTTAVRTIHVIEGKPTLSADLMVALLLRSPHCLFFRCIETTDKQATYSTHRRGDPKPLSVTFTIEDAKKAQLIKGGSNWEKRPRVMLRHRAAAELARLVYPDVILGLYVEGEIQECADVTPHLENLTAAPTDIPAKTVPTETDEEPTTFLDLIASASDQSALDSIRADMKTALDPVPADLVAAWKARQKELAS